MYKKIIMHILYGLKVILMWILIVNFIFAAYGLAKEFRVKVKAVPVVLGAQTDSHYDTALCFFADIEGEQKTVYTECMTHKSGDNVEVILRDGNVYTVREIYEEDVYTPFRYRFLRGMEYAGGNTVALAAETAVFAAAFLICFNMRGEIKDTYPGLMLVTYVLGGIMAATVLILGVTSMVIGGLDSIPIGLAAVVIKLIISAGLLIAWIKRSISFNLWGD